MIRTLRIDSTHIQAIEFWMSPRLQGAKEAVQILNRIYFSPAMAYLLQDAEDDSDLFLEVIEQIPIQDLDERDPEALKIHLDPGNKKLSRALDKEYLPPYL